MKPYKSILSDGSYYLSIPSALVHCPTHILIIMLLFNIIAIYKDWTLNEKIFETYRSSKTGNPTIDPLNEVPKDQLEKEQCSVDSIDGLYSVSLFVSEGLYMFLSESESDMDSKMRVAEL